MQLGLSSIGVNCYAISEVSKNGGKYGRRRATLKTGWRPRKGGILSEKSLSPTTLVMVYGQYRSGKSFQWGPIRRSFCKCNQNLSPPETYVALDVDHNVAFTWHWTSVKYPEPVGRCDGSAQ
jgi:hypothetical protein